MLSWFHLFATFALGVIGFFIWRSRQEDEDEDDFDEPTFGITALPPPTSNTSDGAALEEKKEFLAGPLTIYYGSQTGTAEGFAKTLCNEARYNYFEAKTMDLEDFLGDEFVAEQSHVMFVLATYGEGDPTDNAVEFMAWLREASEAEGAETLLSHIKFSVFGLGNRQYEHYNKMSKEVYAGLRQMGATPVFPYGDGDDDGTLEDDFMNWKDGLWPALRTEFLGDSNPEDGAAAGATGVALPPPPSFSFQVNIVKDPAAAAEEEGYELVGETKGSAASPSSAAKMEGDKRFFHCVNTKVLAFRELLRPRGSGDGAAAVPVAEGEGEASTFHLELDARALGLDYTVADNLGVYPANPPSVVQGLCRWLNYNPAQWIDFEPLPGHESEGTPFPTPCTLQTALSQYLDVNGMPRRGLLGNLAHYATRDSERDRLALLAGRQGKEEYNTWVVAAKRSISEVFEAFPSLQIPVGHFVQLLPRLQPRYFTISSSPMAHPNRIHLTVALLREEREQSGNGRAPLRGLCSTFLHALQPPPTNGGGKRTDSGGSGKRAPWPTLHAFVRPSSFVLPQDPATPIIMVGPGTGIAPMRALLQERQWQRRQQQQEEAAGGELVTVGPTALFFGCRHADRDFLYEEEFLAAAQEGSLTHLYTAFSRDQPQKVYVQHLLAEQGRQLWRWLHHQDAMFYVCGGTLMGRQVMAAVEALVARHGCMEEDAAATYVKNLQDDGRYISELWS